MVSVRIRGQDADIDVEEELRAFEWTRPRWTGDKLIAASPFRYDHTPSFFVNLSGERAGVWGDSGAYDEEWRSGNFVKLMAFLRNESYEEAEEYLLGTYGITYASPYEQLTLGPVNLRMNQRNRQALNEDLLAQYQAGPCEYLRGRGISDEAQRMAGVYYHEKQSAAILPWRTASGKLANVKYRKIWGKLFWYESGATPIRELVWGLDVVRKLGAKTAVLCEAEIDGLSWLTAGFASVAVGGVAFNRTKRDLIIRSPIEELIIATDNDKAGEKLREEVERELRGYVRVRQAYVGAKTADGGFSVKDANEALVKYGVESLREAAALAKLSTGLYANLRTSLRGK
ncbi:toprim domain-containing protein [Peribacillus huizhouensis]|uniref:DNA primase n=1 Tax=Peribacillus huizhouensis TaxID=1501239 RepID=A0ABR6CRB2_9BACI|nr:toprim domain-containing protein [Peribacillus huizhouensis]MBA9027573.1 DNA primase [Peribacillus huizhouensis]